MASVWVARLRAKHGFEKLVAIKTILPKLADDPRFQQMFLDEARIASKIDHGNVAHVLDLGDEHGVLYLVMEWVDGDSLSKLQRAVKASGGSIPLAVALRIVADACAGLHAAHELRDVDGHTLGVVHRDVSPQNILVASAGVVKVIDFGIAKARDRAAGETSTGSLKGKIQFMAPEQAVGQPIDRRADVWSTGCVLYALLGGDSPYDDKNQYATLHLIASGARPAPLPESVPKEVLAIVDKALSFDAKDRFATMAEMQRALETVMSDLDATATSHEVAEFVALHLAPRADQRRKAIDLALRAAAERDRVQQVLSLPLSDSSPREMLATVPEREKTNPSIATLGASALSSLPFARPRRLQKRVVLGVVGVSAAIVLFALGRVTTTTHDAPVSAHAAPAATSDIASASAPSAALPPVPIASAFAIASSAPSATASARPASAPHPIARPRPPQSSATAAPPAKKRPVDDGF